MTIRVRALRPEETSQLTELARSRKRGAGLVRRAQDLSDSSHRHSLGWHRSPRSSACDEQSAEPPPSGRAIANPLPGWPTSNRNGRDQIGIGGRLQFGISGRLPPESAI
jgi:hypothetical protein